jgi:hypothetical protein
MGGADVVETVQSIGCRPCAVAGPWLPTQVRAALAAARFAGNFEFIRLNPTESDRSIFQSHQFVTNDEFRMMNGENFQGMMVWRLASGGAKSSKHHLAESESGAPGDEHAGGPPALRSKGAG